MKVATWLRHALRRDSRALWLACLLLLAALAMPPIRWPRDTYEHVLVFDITQSMNVEDQALAGAPISRLDYAREAARQALRELPCGSRVGWGAFAEYRTLLLLAPIEVCGNYGDLLASLDNIDGRLRWGNASEVSKGVFWSLRAAKELGSNPSVVFLSDGQEAPPVQASQLALFDDVKPGQIGGWLVGVGGDVPRPIPKTNEQGQRVGYWRADDVVQRSTASGEAPSHEHLSELREGHLRALAAEVGLGYARLDTPQALSALLRDPKLARRAPVATDVAWLPAGAALLVLAAYFRPETGRRRKSAALAPDPAPRQAPVSRT